MNMVNGYFTKPVFSFKAPKLPKSLLLEHMLLTESFLDLSLIWSVPGDDAYKVKAKGLERPWTSSKSMPWLFTKRKPNEPARTKTEGLSLSCVSLIPFKVKDTTVVSPF